MERRWFLAAAIAAKAAHQARAQDWRDSRSGAQCVPPLPAFEASPLPSPAPDRAPLLYRGGTCFTALERLQTYAVSTSISTIASTRTHGEARPCKMAAGDLHAEAPAGKTVLSACAHQRQHAPSLLSRTDGISWCLPLTRGPRRLCSAARANPPPSRPRQLRPWPNVCSRGDCCFDRKAVSTSS